MLTFPPTLRGPLDGKFRIFVGTPNYEAPTLHYLGRGVLTGVADLLSGGSFGLEIGTLAADGAHYLDRKFLSKKKVQIVLRGLDAPPPVNDRCVRFWRVSVRAFKRNATGTASLSLISVGNRQDEIIDA